MHNDDQRLSFAGYSIGRRLHRIAIGKLSACEETMNQCSFGGTKKQEALLLPVSVDNLTIVPRLPTHRRNRAEPDSFLPQTCI